MSYCLNPECPQPHNANQTRYCQTCGTQLLLKERYRAVQPIGEGGFGKTFLAIDEHRLDTFCVIKQFLPQVYGTGTLKQDTLTKAIEMFYQEAVRLDELGEHNQIPTLLAYFEQENRLYLIQQFIEGPNLLQELHLQGPFDEAKIRTMLLDLLPILKFIHDRQVIHRDIKPGNILRRNQDSKLILIDFGVAKQLTDVGLARPGTKIGTEGYAPIEQWRGGKAYPASDLYSLSATCVHLLTGQRPDHLFDPLTGRWMWQDYLAREGKPISDRLQQILDKLLRDVVSERYQSADEVLKLLQPPATPISPTTSPPRTAPPRTAVAVPVAFVTSPTGRPGWYCAHTLTGHGDRVKSIAIHLAQQLLVSGSSDKTIKLWNLETGELRQTLTGHTASVHTVALSPNGKLLASGSGDKTIKLWNPETGELQQTLTYHSNWVNALAFSQDGRFLASGSEDKTIKLWNLETGELQRTFSGHTGSVYAVALSPDGEFLASGSGDRSLRLWDIPTGKVRQTLTRHASRINSLAMSPDGKTLVSGSEDSTIKLWQLPDLQLQHTLTEHTDGVTAVAISADSQLLVSGSSDKAVKLWDLQTGRLIQTLSGHSWWVNTVAIAVPSPADPEATALFPEPPEPAIASGSADKIIQIWRLSV